MKAKDLMIGDWVCVTKNFAQKYHQIRALSNDEEDVLKGIYINNYGNFLDLRCTFTYDCGKFYS